MASILNNVAALQATRQLNITSLGMKSTIERLTTGKRINHASDDATGLANANNYNADSKVAHELRKTSYQTYYTEAAKDGYLEEATNQVMRAIELAAGGNGSSSEFSSVASLASAAATKAGTSLSSITDLASASTALTAIATARGTIAANMATAQSNANLYGIEEENKTAQMSNIMDADIGAEVVSLTKWQILSQAGTSALTNANTASQTVLGLLR
ncbi:MAG: fliC [Holophagaceae bacterium]|nr:fliC [Holophagaceae bacterium]